MQTNETIEETPLERIKKLMENHDWFFDYSDDHQKWRRGFDEKIEILQLSKKIPLNQIPGLLLLVPIELRKAWQMDIQKFHIRQELK